MPRRSRPTASPRPGRVGAIAVAAMIVGAAAAPVAAGPPAIDIAWTVGNAPPVLVAAEGVPTGGGASYLGGLADDAWDVQWAFFADLDLGDGRAVLTNGLTITNLADAPAAVTVVVRAPVTGTMDASSLAGTARLELTADATAASLQTLGAPAWSAMVGPEAVAGLFVHPSAFSSPAFTSSSSALDSFGAPVPLAGPPVESTIGTQLRVELSAGDTVTVFGEFEIDAAAALPGDVTGDGTVDVADLLLVLGAWGACPPGPCPQDATGDGAVGVADLLLVLGAWSVAG